MIIEIHEFTHHPQFSQPLSQWHSHCHWLRHCQCVLSLIKLIVTCVLTMLTAHLPAWQKLTVTHGWISFWQLDSGPPWIACDWRIESRWYSQRQWFVDDFLLFLPYTMLNLQNWCSIKFGYTGYDKRQILVYCALKSSLWKLRNAGLKLSNRCECLATAIRGSIKKVS